MHGQKKTDKSEVLKEKEKKQKDAKLKAYREGMATVFERRKNQLWDWETLHAVGDVLTINPDVYTLWNIRKEVLLHMIEDKTLDDPKKVGEGELRLTESCLKYNPKSYGAWHHRCWILDHFPELDLKLELALCNKYLKLDSRNFHCWDYRRFIANKLGISSEEELQCTMQKIEEDFSNYSSWHYRSKLLPMICSDPAGVRPIAEEMHLHELDLVQNAAFTDPSDSSAWFYLRWLLGRLTPKLEAVLVYFSKETEQIHVGFNVPASLDEVKINGIGHTAWETVDSHKHSSLWVTNVSPSENILSYTDTYTMDIEVLGDTQTIELTESNGFIWFKAPQFDPDVSPKLKAVLEDQLKSCNQLLELEPDSKWPLLTSVVLMRAIDTSTFQEEIISRLKDLMKSDSYRQSYYSDLMSKFLMEEKLKTHDLTSKTFSLKNLGITSLYHTQYLARAEVVDLSGNCLQSLSPLTHAVSCTELDLRDNDMPSRSLASLPLMPRVTMMYTNGNRIDRDDVEACKPKLPSVSLFYCDVIPKHLIGQARDSED